MSTCLTPREVGIRWFEDIWNGRKIERVHELMAPDGVGHLEGGQIIRGPKEFEAFFETLIAGMPDLELEIVDTLAENEGVCVRWQAKGTHQGEILGFVATAAPVSFHGVTWFRVVDGKVVEGWDNWNFDGMVRQLAGAPAGPANLA